MGFIGAAGVEGTGDQGFPIDISGPSFGERKRQGKQDRPACKRQPCGTGAYSPTAGIDHQRAGGQQYGHFVKAQRLLAAGEEAPRCGTIERRPHFRHLGQQRRHSSLSGRLVRAGKRVPRRGDAQRAQCEFGHGQLGHRRQ